MLLIAIFWCVHGGAMKPFGQNFMEGRKVALSNITGVKSPFGKDRGNVAQTVQG